MNLPSTLYAGCGDESLPVQIITEHGLNLAGSPIVTAPPLPPSRFASHSDLRTAVVSLFGAFRELFGTHRKRGIVGGRHSMERKLPHGHPWPSRLTRAQKLTLRRWDRSHVTR